MLDQLSFFANLLSAILLNAILLIPTLLSATLLSATLSFATQPSANLYQGYPVTELPSILFSANLLSATLP
jgi:hypothetical protein